jgi:hypothetical protein
MENSYVKSVVKSYGGRLVPNSDPCYDGKYYEYEAIFDSDEQIEDCLGKLNVIKSDTTYLNSYLTCFFSMPD